MSVEEPRAPEGLYVTGPRWHLVRGPRISTPETGGAYLFRCFRWMSAREAEGHGLYRGVPNRAEPVCGFCLEWGNADAAAADGVGASDEPDED